MSAMQVGFGKADISPKIGSKKIGSLRDFTATEIRDPLRHELGWQSPGDAPQALARGMARYLSTEVAWGFTGVFFGLYATGNGRPCAGPAYFDWFDYRTD